ncbi:MAG: hypothetical protein ACTSR2_14910, partial [Candidatus Hodarchaeales archaeon]
MKRKIVFSYLIIIALSLSLTVLICSANPSPIIKFNFSFKSSYVSDQYNVSLLYENQYHNLSQVYEELANFNTSAPAIVDYGSIGLSYYNNSIPLITLTNENIPSYSKGKTYIVAHHHAREQ